MDGRCNDNRSMTPGDALVLRLAEPEPKTELTTDFADFTD